MVAIILEKRQWKMKAALGKNQVYCVVFDTHLMSTDLLDVEKKDGRMNIHHTSTCYIRQED